jgi:CO/xanthine dehydrogenase Mo-binding subunit
MPAVTRVVGRNARRAEGPDKLCGTAKYVDDYALPGCLFGATLRSTIACGRIRSLTLDPAFPWSEYVVVTADDIPGANHVALIENDQPLLAKDRIRHPQEPILLVAHPVRAKAYAALAHVRVEYEEETPVLDAERSLTVFKSFHIERGAVDRGLAGAFVTVEGEYRVPHQEQAYIETNGAAAWFEPDGTLVTLGSLQCPHYVVKALKASFGLPEEKLRVVQAVTGGGFGGKEEYPNVICAHAALLARKAGRPVKIVYDRHEDMLATTKRHPARIRHRTGVRRDGTLVAQDIDIVMDGGAYVTLSPVVLSRGALHATGPYSCANVRVRARAVATNTPPNGAFRGFGAPQTLFAAESHMEKIAAALGIDAVTLRRKNLVKKGSILATGQVLRESIGARQVLDICVKRSDYRRKRRAYDLHNRDGTQSTWKGIGLAVVHHGSGFTGRGEVTLASRASVVLGRDGAITVLAASTEIGQGTTTMLAQITADALGVPVDWVDVEVPDTWKVPNSGPTVASRTCMVVGGLLQRAAVRLRDQLIEVVGAVPTTRAAFVRAAQHLCGDRLAVRADEDYRKPPEVTWDEDAYRGDAYAVYSYGAAAVDLEIDRATFEVTVRKVTTAHDVGKAINPLLVEGQIIGGLVQGLGYALLEHVVYRDGVMRNAELTNYVIPTSLDVPPFDVVLVERPYSRGPWGAKGVGELPMDVSPPAVASAVFHATGTLIPKLPILPETIGAADLARP